MKKLEIAELRAVSAGEATNIFNSDFISWGKDAEGKLEYFTIRLLFLGGYLTVSPINERLIKFEFNVNKDDTSDDRDFTFWLPILRRAQ